jgi:hypothetical protein
MAPLRHVKRLLGEKMLVDVSEKSVEEYQNRRLQEHAAPKVDQRGSWVLVAAHE